MPKHVCEFSIFPEPFLFLLRSGRALESSQFLLWDLIGADLSKLSSRVAFSPMELFLLSPSDFAM